MYAIYATFGVNWLLIRTGGAMKRVEAQQFLAATNRWWRDPAGWTGDDPDLREARCAPFRYRPDVLSGLAPGGLHILRGPRRVGKTVAVKDAIRELISSGVPPRCIVHMAVDGLRSRDLGLLVDAADLLMPGKGHRYLFVDEITGIVDWPRAPTLTCPTLTSQPCRSRCWLGCSTRRPFQFPVGGLSWPKRKP